MVLFTIVEFYNEDDVNINHHGFLRNVSQHETKISKQEVDVAEVESNGKMVPNMPLSYRERWSILIPCFQKIISPNGNWIPVDLGKTLDVGRVAKIIGDMTFAHLNIYSCFNILLHLFSDSKVVPAFVVIFAFVYWCVAISAYLDNIDNI